MSEFLTLVTSNGVEGLVVGLLVLVFVFGLSWTDVTVTGNQKRFANVVLSILLAGVSLVNPESQDAIVAAIASVASALTYELIRALAKKQADRKAKG